MNKRNLMIAFLLLFNATVFAQDASRKPMAKLINDEFKFAADQYKILARGVEPGLTPQSFKDGKNVNYDIKWWCSGFYSGSLWYIYEQTKDEAIKKEAESALKVIEPNQTYTGNHDLGFMMYCSFGNAYRITAKPEYKTIINRSAESLSTRYHENVKAIQSWNKSKFWDYPVIIDNMMNLEMLNWVSDNGGSQKYKDISVVHANTTLRNHFRPDFSSFHVVDYNPETGAVKRKATWQGAADCSAWARGQAWALYGYTMMYRFTQDKSYLKQAKGIAHFILNHPNLPADKVPFWDFDAQGVPFAKRDASAAAIMASALLELGQYTTGAEKNEFKTSAETMIYSLSSDAYHAKLGENGGFLLMHSTGAYPLNSEIDVPLIYADYYYLEALARYKNWYL
ncbi:glycoside hydrolase family 88 protein [Pedobacter endophyticus]|uniref:Glycoside hydrolase family 88 protein n=1 Tax=Pedobacter endophyticus TaxID=2789740 RepID=A0A7S9PY93_9SPHI|nr:glycoside hydrolase family 88 protein [Pedobacter endophyticus]QPH38988.1 glycoside hydrolase family 88 protein [Pedobacter endophyticus]